MVEVVRASADLREIVSDYIPLKKSGSRYRALCPFHTEKTPSFYVDADKQLFYCFGCGAGGDVFKFLMLYEKLEFPEALRTLAGRYGIAVPEPGARRGEDSDRQKVLAVNRQALGYFREQFTRPAGEKARRYLAGRGIAPETVERFLLGYAPEGWSGVKAHLARSLPEEQAVLAGLLARKEETGRTYDRFRDRVIFPIVNLSDEVIGFGGRVIDGGEPKYLNSPETAAFSKGENLYALPLAKEAVRKEGYAVLVEGYMDAIALHQAGVAHVVATLGTGFTAGHVRLLKRYTDRVVVNFDPDAAGRAATKRSLEVLLENGFEVQVVALPSKQDPDLYVREHGVDAYRKRLTEALPYIEFLAREVAARVDLATSKGKVEALNGVLPFLARLDNPVRRAGHVEMLATVFGIEDRMVLQELNGAVRERRRDLGPAGTAAAAGTRLVSEAESRLLRAVMDDAGVREALLGEIVEEEDLERSRITEVIRAIRRLVEKGDDVTYPRVGADISDAARELLTRIAATPHPPATLEEGRGCLRALRAERFQRQMGDIQKRLERGGEAAVVDELLRNKVTLKRRIEALRDASGS
ncbi:MAG TPA: DNA primase [Candidatus Polarisedimenticolia bacterium]|nr:DNA primase [Candidatus Polarisedimenticolia bacterium]